MEHQIQIITDANGDLPKEYLDSNHIIAMPMGYIIDQETYTGEKDSDLPLVEFYSKLRKGSETKTVALAPDYVKNVFQTVLESGKDIVYIAFSSGLSSTYNSGRIAKEELDEQYPDHNIVVIDSLCASLGQGLLINEAVVLLLQNKTITEMADILEKRKMQICHYFTVDDLHFLQRGGRVSKTTAIIGSMLGIKPVLHVNEEGKLISIQKVRGRKQSLEMLVQKMAEKTRGCQNDVVFISHGDCEQDARYVADLVKQKFGIQDSLIHLIGPSIGSHSGPGTVALFFFGSDRAEKPM